MLTKQVNDQQKRAEWERKKRNNPSRAKAATTVSIALKFNQLNFPN